MTSIFGGASQKRACQGPLTWPASRLGEALDALIQKGALCSKGVEIRNPGPGIEQDSAALNRWMEASSARAGLEAEPVNIHYSELEKYLRSAGPALIGLPCNFHPSKLKPGLLGTPGKTEFLAVLSARKGKVRVLGANYAIHTFPADWLRQQLCSEIEAPLMTQIDGILRRAGIQSGRSGRARNAILKDRLAALHVAHGWLLRLPPGSPFWRQVCELKLPQQIASLAGTHLAEYLLWIGSWWMIGFAALEGRLGGGWLLAWALMLLTLVPVRMLETRLQGRIAITGGGLLKLRVLAGALRLDADEIRHRGAGQFLGQVMEAEAVESLALDGGFLALMAAIELVLSGMILAVGAGGITQSLLLAAWVLGSVWLGWRYFCAARNWTRTRLDMTHGLVERMVGHRTRLAQQPASHWHEGEDQELDRYLSISQPMDRCGTWAVVVVPRGWLVIGLASTVPVFFRGTGSVAGLAVSIGGILLAFGALQRLSSGVGNLAGAGIAWEQVAQLFHAAGRLSRAGHPHAAATSGADGSKLMKAYDVGFRYQGRSEPVLHHCNLSIRAEDRILLEGPSGSGKSTLAALLTGLRSPESGILLLDGLDRHTLGTIGWQHRVAAAPQFHENHVLTGTFAFNALMARDGLHTWNDLQEAEAICNELGLGDLIKRMPAGILQMVGDTGWQLSHGERSRLFIARALLQRADLIVLDESFAALDPENLRCALECVLRHARTVMVIAHR